MSILVWLILGLATGWAAAKLFGARGQHLAACLALGVVGALVGGFAFSALTVAGTSALDFHTMNLAMIGAFLALALYLWLMGRRLPS
ncbi:MAG: GlsB/YeaQ/YmgE family stress response membrane protein [Geminicoccaceae bacterium]|nr:MAG: GlsB/YeaQ/YmgE family stress response membrane protein [Geminicoccaceae bacterium]